MSRYSLPSRVFGTAAALAFLAWSLIAAGSALGVVDIVSTTDGATFDLVASLYIGAGVVGAVSFVPALIALYRPNGLHPAAFLAFVSVVVVLGGDVLGSGRYGVELGDLAQYYADAAAGGYGWQGFLTAMHVFGALIVLAAWLVWFGVHRATRPSRTEAETESTPDNPTPPEARRDEDGPTDESGSSENTQYLARSIGDRDDERVDDKAADEADERDDETPAKSADADDAALWYVHISDESWGPFTRAQLQQMLDEDRVTPLTPAHSPATEWTSVAAALQD